MTVRNQSEKAYEVIRNRLIAQSIKPGSRLTEQAWAKNLGVNRGDLRQAFARLLAEGLVIKGLKGGVFAREYSEEYIRKVNEVRLLLETAAARLAVQRATEEDICALEKIGQHLKIMAENGFAMGSAEADVRFHEVLISSAHNSKLTEIYQQANIPITVSAVTPISREQLIRAASDHQQMVDALREKDVDLLIELLSKGLEEEE